MSLSDLLNNTGYIFDGMSNAWALLNLILVVIGIFLALLALIDNVREKRRRKVKKITDIDTLFIWDDHNKEDEKKIYRSRLDWLVMAELLGGASVLVFLFTQNINSIMVLMNWMTIAHVILFIVEIIALRFVYKPEKVGGK